MVRGPSLPLSPHTLEARGECAGAGVEGERLELDTVERHLTGDALGTRQGVQREYGPPLPPAASLRSSCRLCAFPAA